MKRYLIVKLIIGVLTAASMRLQAGYANGTGEINALSVGRLSNQFFVKINGTNTGKPACATHPNFDFAFYMTRRDAQDLLSNLLTAYAASLDILIVSQGTCTVDPAVEDVNYLWLQK